MEGILSQQELEAIESLTGAPVGELVEDIRQIMETYSAFGISPMAMRNLIAEALQAMMAEGDTEAVMPHSPEAELALEKVKEIPPLKGQAVPVAVYENAMSKVYRNPGVIDINDVVAIIRGPTVCREPRAKPRRERRKKARPRKRNKASVSQGAPKNYQ